MVTVKANPNCHSCHGSGTVYDSVPYGGTNAWIPSVCEDCIEFNIAQGNITEEEAEYVDLESCGDELDYYDDPDSLPGGIDYY